ncbi:battenin CLN3 protein [Dissophora globulifera]|nr:battenin CLN3 protein [Dissophora globulifera]
MGVVLLADITPSLLIKMIAPYFIHKVPYPVRIIFCASLSFSAIVLIAMADTISIRLIGVMMASLSSGLGELTFLMLSSFYRLQMVSAWSSGTGGAGLLGALLFLALTSWIGLSVSRTLGIVSLFPSLMLFAYFILLRKPSQNARYHAEGYRPVSSHNHNDSEIEEEELLASPTRDSTHHPRNPSTRSSGTDEPTPATEVPFASSDSNSSGHGSTTSNGQTVIHPSQSNVSVSTVTDVPPIGLTMPVPSGVASEATTGTPTSATPALFTDTLMAPTSWNATPSWDVPQQHMEPTSINTLLAATDPDDPEFVSPFRETLVRGSTDLESSRRRVYKTQPNEAMTLQEKFAMARSLLVPFMVPLFLVYVTEYTMNQGVLPVILFPLDKTPFTHLRDLGVFISRSSASLIQISRLWIPSFLQLITLLVATSQALFSTASTPFPIPSIYLVFVLILWEGLLGGATYVHTYIGISHDLEHDPKGKEFALGVVGVADGLGIMVAGLASLWIEPALCRWQVVEKGVELCLAMAD